MCRDKLNRAKIKFPFPHMMSVIVREKIYQSLQLMSQVHYFTLRVRPILRPLTLTHLSSPPGDR